LDGCEPKYCEVIFYDTDDGYRTETGDFYADHMEVTWMVVNWAIGNKELRTKNSERSATDHGQFDCRHGRGWDRA
jgi:hypothetical protein